MIPSFVRVDAQSVKDGSIRDTLIHIRLLGANCLRRITYNFTHASTSSCLADAAMFGLLMGTSICSMISMSRTRGCSLSARMFDIYSSQIGLLTWSIIWRSRLIGMYGESIVVMMTIHPPIRQIIHSPTHPSTQCQSTDNPMICAVPCRQALSKGVRDKGWGLLYFGYEIFSALA